jgi:hypothetical protein
MSRVSLPSTAHDDGDTRGRQRMRVLASWATDLHVPANATCGIRLAPKNERRAVMELSVDGRSTFVDSVAVSDVRVTPADGGWDLEVFFVDGGFLRLRRTERDVPSAETLAEIQRRLGKPVSLPVQPSAGGRALDSATAVLRRPAAIAVVGVVAMVGAGLLVRTLRKRRS